MADTDRQIEGIIVRGVGGQYWIDDRSGGEPVPARARGIFRKDGITPLPGDHVICAVSDDPLVPLQITEIQPRRNALVRPPVANLDCLVITFSLEDPAPDLYLIDKLLIVCAANSIDPILCLTKTDRIIEPMEADRLLAPYETAGFSVLRTGFDEKEGREGREDREGREGRNQLLRLIAGRVVSFAGQSGVGKSTLLNDLFGSERMLTGSTSEKAGRGRHTTRHVELFPFDGGYIADSPGFSSLELETLGVRSEDVLSGYPEIAAAESHCRFLDCRHTGETGCALESMTVDAGRLERYRYFRNLIDSIKSYQQKAAPRQPGGPRGI